MQEREEIELSERCCKVKRPLDWKTLTGAGSGDGKKKEKQEENEKKV